MNRRALFTDDRDLAALVREATDVAPSSALLDRVHASRADGLRVMLPSGDVAAVPVSPNATASAIDQLSVEQLAGRVWMIVIAVAATVVAAVTSLSIKRAVGLMAMQIDSNADHGDVRQRQREQDHLPPGDVPQASGQPLNNSV